MLKAIVMIIVGLILIIVSGPASALDSVTIDGVTYSCIDREEAASKIGFTVFIDRADDFQQVMVRSLKTETFLTYKKFLREMEPIVDEGVEECIKTLVEYCSACASEDVTQQEIDLIRIFMKREIMKVMPEVYEEYRKSWDMVH